MNSSPEGRQLTQLCGLYTESLVKLNDFLKIFSECRDSHGRLFGMMGGSVQSLASGALTLSRVVALAR